MPIFSHTVWLLFRKLQLTIDGNDDNYVPSKIVVQGGEQDNQKTLNTIEIDRYVSYIKKTNHKLFIQYIEKHVCSYRKYKDR